MLHSPEDFGFDVKHALHCLHDIVNLGLYYPQNKDKTLSTGQTIIVLLEC